MTAPTSSPSSKPMLRAGTSSTAPTHGASAWAAGVGGLLSITSYHADGTASATYLPTFDGGGNVTGLVDAASGAVAATYAYDPFGNLLATTGSQSAVDANPFRFSTKYFDSETGLYYYGYRYYSPQIGRWMTRDPMQEGGGVNVYAFVNNDPINKIDPDGLEPQAITAAQIADAMSDAPALITRDQAVAAIQRFQSHQSAGDTVSNERLLLDWASKLDPNPGLQRLRNAEGSGNLPQWCYDTHLYKLEQLPIKGREIYSFQSLLSGTVIYEPTAPANERGEVPCIVCHGVGAGGVRYGPVNYFSGCIVPGKNSLLAVVGGAQIADVTQIVAPIAIQSTAARIAQAGMMLEAASAAEAATVNALNSLSAEARTSLPIIDAQFIPRFSSATGAVRASKWAHGWQKASLKHAIATHAGPKATSWISKSGKVIFENPTNGIQVVVDVEGGYFRIFRPNKFGGTSGTHLNLMGNEVRPARFVKGGAIKNPPLQSIDKAAWETETHFIFEK